MRSGSLQQHYQPLPQLATFAFQTTRTPTNITNIASRSFSIFLIEYHKEQETQLSSTIFVKNLHLHKGLATPQ